MPENTSLPVLCIGSALWDTIASANCAMLPGNDVPGRIRRRPGGVALNIALELVQHGQPAMLLGTMGQDAEGDSLIAELTAAGIDCTHILRTEDPTDHYLAIETPDGEVFGAIADCASLEKAGDAILEPLRNGELSQNGTWCGPIVIDGNLPVSVLQALATHEDFSNARLSFVPASPGKAERLRVALETRNGTLFVNRTEAEILAGRPLADAAEAAHALRTLGAHRAIVTDGPRMTALCDSREVLRATPPKVNAHTTTGAGDVFLATFIAAELASDPHNDSTGDTAQSILQAAADAAAAHVTKDAP